MLHPLTRLLVAVVISIVPAAARGAEAALDPERDLLAAGTAWSPVMSDGVDVRVTREQRGDGGASLRIDFDFTRGAGFGGATLAVPIDLPENYEFAMLVRGAGPANNLECKLIDPENLNVWWINRRGFEWPAEPARLANRQRQFAFAWGPSGGGTRLAKLGRIELIIAANEGGRGTVWIDELIFRPLEPARPYEGTPVVTASATGSGDAGTLMAPGGGAWAAPLDEARPMLTIDFGRSREFGGLRLGFDNRTAVDAATLETSADGTRWSAVRTARELSGFDAYLAVPDLEARYARVRLERAFAGLPAGLRRIEVLPVEAGASMNALWALRARGAPRGTFPRTALNEQSFWTVLGAARDAKEALINEEGQIEIDKRRGSIEPVLRVGEGVLTWAEGTHAQRLADGWAPIATVERTHAEAALKLEVTALVAGKPGASALHACYTVTNTGEVGRKGRLVLLARPWQVLPPWQDLNITGGWAPTRTAANREGALVLDGDKVIFSPNYAEIAALAFDQGDPMEWLRAGRWPSTYDVACPQRAASGMMGFDWELGPGKSASYLITVPLYGTAPPEEKRERPLNREGFEALARYTQLQWADLTGRALLTGPPAAREFIDTVRATQAYILINHDGQGFQPGSRTYERSWIRDGSMTSAAMLEFGHPGLVKDFIDWYAPFQFASGKVPCVVDRRGADPVPEHDSHGQLIWLIATQHRYTGDAELVSRHFGRVRKAVEFIRSLRAERSTAEFAPGGPPRREPGKPAVPAEAFRGLVPASISHEGYSSKPMHSYWDTLFIYRGLRDAAYLAGVMGEAALAREWAAEADSMRESLRASVEAVHAAHGIDYWPGCVELGDFDSTSSTIVAWPVEAVDDFPRAWTDATFERSFRDFAARRDGNAWDGYTPYELRHVNAYVRLGKKDHALATLEWLMRYRRPTGWRHWAEVVWREPTTPRMIGDMPHTWCGSDFLNAARAMLMFEDHARGSLVLFAGLPEVWASTGEGFMFQGLASEYGTLTASARPSEGGGLAVRITGRAQPPGGFDVASPRAGLRGARVNGQSAEIAPGDRVRVPAGVARPITIDLSY